MRADRSKILPSFLGHMLGTRRFHNYVERFQVPGNYPAIPDSRIRNFKLPVPPLEVQREIVGILDKFTELEAEREITVRVSTGATPKAGNKAYYEGGTIPWLRTGEVTFRDIWETSVSITERALKETTVRWIPENCVIVAISGATAARSAINRIPLTTNQHCCNLQIDPSKASYRYVFHWVRSEYETLKSLGRGARSDLNVSIIKRFPIPVPDLVTQNRIADLLDAFDALVNDISVGLPAELAARRKQYEYYRDKLLTFEEAR